MVSSSYSLAWTLRNLLVLTTSQRVLRETCVESADVLTYIFNQSLASGIVPADWRVANIFALHKKGAKELPENYRPISLTSICSKLLEHIVYSSISQFLSDNHIISPRQHGFRPGHSCETQLIHPSIIGQSR